MTGIHQFPAWIGSRSGCNPHLNERGLKGLRFHQQKCPCVATDKFLLNVHVYSSISRNPAVPVFFPRPLLHSQPATPSHPQFAWVVATPSCLCIVHRRSSPYNSLILWLMELYCSMSSGSQLPCSYVSLVMLFFTVGNPQEQCVLLPPSQKRCHKFF